jgi:uncharacterized protein
MASAQRAALPAHEVKFTPLDLKRVQQDGAFEGYASLFNVEDMGHDVVLPGAFRLSLAERGPSGVKMLFQHDANQPIGAWTSLAEDARGLLVRGQLTLDVAKALDAHSVERETVWTRIEAATFLTPNEKRAAVGYGPVDGGGVVA